MLIVHQFSHIRGKILKAPKSLYPIFITQRKLEVKDILFFGRREKKSLLKRYFLILLSWLHRPTQAEFWL